MSRLLLIPAILALLLATVSVAHAQATTPTVSTVAVTSSPGTDNTYTTLDVITVGLTFSEAVTVTGTPRVTLDIGGTERTVAYSGAGTATGQLLFSYTVQPVDQDDDGISVKANSLALNGGTIQATDDMANANLAHSAMTFAGHKVDTKLTLISNIDQADGTPLRISATQAVRMQVNTGQNQMLFNLNEFIIDVKTASPTLQVTVTFENVFLAGTSRRHYRFTGSATEAGEQVFSYVEPDGDDHIAMTQVNRFSAGPHFIYITGSGAGFVELGTTASGAEDSVHVGHWNIGDGVARSTNGGSSYQAQAGAHIPRIRMVGHAREVLRVESAVISSWPYSGNAYALGETIDMDIRLNGPYRVVRGNLTAPLLLGDGDGNQRDAHLVSTYAIYGEDTFWHGFFRDSLLQFAYTVQQADRDTDGVELAANPLGAASEGNIVSAVHPHFPTDLSVQAFTGGPTQQVNGSAASICDAIHCTHLDPRRVSDGSDAGGFSSPVFDPNGDAGLSSRLIRYQGIDYPISQVTFTYDDSDDPPRSPANLVFGGRLTSRAQLRLGMQVGDTVLPLQTASHTYIPADDIDSAAPFEIDYYGWNGAGISWEDDVNMLVKFVELPVTATFDAASYAADEGGSVQVTVTLGGPFQDKTVTLPLSVSNNGGAANADYSGVPSQLVFMPEETEKTFTVSVTDDTLDDDDESVTLSFGTLPDTVKQGGDNETATVAFRDDDDPEVTVQYGQATQGVGEGETVNVTVSLSADPERTVTIPVTATGQDGATSADYSVPSSVTFNDGEVLKTIAFTAANDEADDDDESVKLGFGTALPSRVTLGTRTETTLNIGDDDDPSVTVAFASATYTVAEGGTQTVTVNVSADPDRTIIIPVTATLQGTASAADYSGVPPSVTFTDGGSTSQTFTFTATQDLIDDDDEGLKLGFGTMPDPRVSAGTTDETTLSITDDDTAGIVLSPASLTVAEEDSTGAGYTVALATEPTVDVTVTISGHAGTDLTLQGPRLTGDVLTFTPDNWNRPQTVTVTAAHDDDGVNDDETLTHTAAGGEYAGVAKALPVTATDNDPLGISIDPPDLPVDESDSADYAVRLDTEPTVDVTVTITGQEDTDLTLSGPTLNNDALTFTAANWDTPQTVTITADHDDDTDDDTGTLTHTGGGGEYDGLDNGLTVRTNDNTGDLRLVDGTLTDADGTPCEGRLEIYYNGAWGTICDDYWTEAEADVACRQLGFVGGSVDDWHRFRSAYFPPGTSDQAIVLDDVDCTGRESNLFECGVIAGSQLTPLSQNCKHKEDVGIRCIKNSEGPYVTGMVISGPPGDNGKYDVDETVTVTVTWSEAVNVVVTPPVAPSTESRPPHLHLRYGSPGAPNTEAVYTSGAGTATTVFTATVEDQGGAPYSRIDVYQESLSTEIWDWTPGQDPVGSFITSVATNKPAILGHGFFQGPGSGMQTGMQAEAVTITGVPAFNDPGEDGVFEAGDTVEVTFTFSQPVRVDKTGGAPSVPVLLSGTTERQAAYRRGSGSGQLVFGYTLTGEDGAHSSLLVEPNSLALNGGAIRDSANNLDAAIGHVGGGAIFVRQAQDETAPQLESATVDGSSLTLAFDEDLDNGNTLPSGLFGVNVNEASRSVMGVAVGEANVTLLLASAVAAGDTVTVDYTVPTDESAARLQDQSGNAAESFSGQAATNNTPSGEGTSQDNREEAANRAATGAPAITGTAQVGSTLTVDTTGIGDEDGLENATFSYQWLADDTEISGATGSSYTLVASDEGKAIKVSVTFADDAGNEESLTSAATATVAARPNSAATGAPRIDGSPVVGRTLTAATSGVADEDGTGNAVFAYQWIRHDPATAADADIQGATASTYTATGADVGKTIKVRVSFTDDAGNEESLASAATATVAARPNSAATGAPRIDGSPVVGRTLTAATSGVVDENGTGNAVLAYQWIRHDPATAADADIEGATASTYTATGADVGKALKVRVAFTDDAGNEESLASAATATVAARPNSAATGAPRIDGSPVVGQTLTAATSGVADENGTGNAVFAYQWIRHDPATAANADIQGATASTYTATGADVGKALKVRVTFTDDAGNEESLASAATATVAPRPNSPATGAPTISGTAQVRETLTASTSGIADTDGLTNATFSHQWLAGDTEISGATGSGYTLGDADVGKTIKVRVSFTDDQENAETLTSAATAAVAPRPNSPVIRGTARVGETLTADTSDISDPDGVENAVFAYQWIAGGADIGEATASTYTVAAGDEGLAIRVWVSFTDDEGNPETRTSEGTEAVEPLPNSPATGAPTITGTARVGETLTADTSGIQDAEGMDNAVFTHRWMAGGTDIEGATGASHTLTEDEEGLAIQVWVSFTDDAGNPEALTSAATGSVAARPSPLTASISAAPESHDGHFTFELRFSEEFGISYKTLQDHVFTVTGGEVNKARRLNPPSNTGWEIHVTPDGDGDVTIVLPVTTDCTATGAVCTEDGRMLSGRLELTVSGAGG